MKHTKGTLRISKSKFGTDIVIDTEPKVNICIMTSGFSNKNKVNAERIVKCWNMHDELLAIAKNTLDDMNGLRNQDMLNENGIKYHQHIKDIIKKATE